MRKYTIVTQNDQNYHKPQIWKRFPLIYTLFLDFDPSLSQNEATKTSVAQTQPHQNWPCKNDHNGLQPVIETVSFIFQKKWLLLCAQLQVLLGVRDGMRTRLMSSN